MRLCTQLGTDEGSRTCLYRSPSEIREDMHRILDGIRRTEERLNVRDMVVSAVCETENPRTLIPILEEIVAQSHEALKRIQDLEGDLLALQSELESVRGVTF